MSNDDIITAQPLNDETRAVCFSPAEIEALSKEQAIDASLVWIKWNDGPQAYRILAIWGKAHDENPRFIASLDVMPRGGHGARAMLTRAHNMRTVDEVRAVLGADWTDTWTK